MPELPEVETTCRGIAPAIEGRILTAVNIRESRLRYPVPADLNDKLVGAQLRQVSRRAKYILLEFDAASLIIHLGMSGSLRVVTPVTPILKHDHVDLVYGTNVLRLHDPRRFGALLWAPHPALDHPLLSKLGVEPLEDEFDGALLYAATRNKKTPIKLLIMDAHMLVGVGNIYASESLFRARILPTKPAGTLTRPQCGRLAAEIRTTLQEAIQAGGSTLRNYVNADGNTGYFQQTLYVYGREGEKCSVCNTPITRIIMGQRATFYCSHCQR